MLEEKAWIGEETEHYGQSQLANVEAVDRQAEPSWLQQIKFEAVDCLLLTIKCETAISQGLQGFACTFELHSQCCCCTVAAETSVSTKI